MQTIRGKLSNINRGRNSRNGNPRLRLWIDGVMYTTNSDSMLGYEINQNWIDHYITAEVDRDKVVHSAFRS